MLQKVMHMVKKHKEVVAAVSVFFQKSTKSHGTSSESSQRNVSSSTQQQTLELTVDKSQVSTAEIKWALQTVIIILLNCSKLCFLIVRLQKCLHLVQIKQRYIINHGIAPYFHEILKANVNLVNFKFPQSIPTFGCVLFSKSYKRHKVCISCFHA